MVKFINFVPELRKYLNMKILKLLLLLPVVAGSVSCSSGNGGSSGWPDPVITGVETAYDGKVIAGEPVTLKGKNFSAQASDNKVLYGVGLDATALRVSEATETSVVFTAPEISDRTLIVRVSTHGKESNMVTLEYTVLPTPDTDPEDPDWSDTPTIDLVKLGGKTVTVVPGVEWTSFHGTWDGSIRNINVVKTVLNEHNKLGIYFNYGHTYPDGYKPVLADGEDDRDLDKKCIYLDAVAGTNGPMACCHFVRVDGNVMHAPTEQEPWVVNCAITIDGDVIDIVKVKDNYGAQKLPNQTVGCAGPLLVWKGIIQKDPAEWRAADTDNWLTTTHPRTAIGLSKDGKTVIQVTVDGRWSKSGWPSEQTAIGMSTERLAKLMRGLGCYKAMNFDGGGGTAMWVYGQGNSRNIVNRVSENRWDWNGTKLRPTGNAVYIKSDLKK